MMNLSFMILYYLIFICSVLQCQEKQDDKIENGNNCRERNRLITTDFGDIYMLVDAVLGNPLILQCHYCKENDDQQPKIWYRMKRLRNTIPKEVKLGMDSNSSHNRVLVNSEHSLTFRNITVNDTGFYYCIGLEEQESGNKYSYFVDVVPENETTPETGNLTVWRKYQKEYFVPINKQFGTAENPEFLIIREKLFRKMELVTEWEPWGTCEVCSRPRGDGRRRKKGFCRLKLTSLQKNITMEISKRASDNSTNDEDTLTFLDAYELSCRSLILERAFPDVSSVTKFLPHFIQIERCEGICDPGSEGLNKGWKTGKSLGFKYKKTYVLAQDAHLTLICPESSLENVVIWRRNGKALNPGESLQPAQPDAEPRITVDTFNTLYLHGVTDEEEGNYTCQVNDVRMQQITIYVVSKSRLLTQAFVRHMMYLAFVLSLTLSCYCAGLVVTWKKRNTFLSYEELVKSGSPNNTDTEESDIV